VLRRRSRWRSHSRQSSGAWLRSFPKKPRTRCSAPPSRSRLAFSKINRRQVRDSGFLPRAKDRARPAGAPTPCRNGTVECGQSASYYYIGKNPAFAFDTALPFGMETRRPGRNAWMYYGGGTELMRDLFRQYNIVPFPPATPARRWRAGNRKEIKTVADLKGLKMRIAGMAGPGAREASGGSAAESRGGRNLPGRLRGAAPSDAAEWVGPYDDEKARLQQGRQILLLPGIGGKLGASWSIYVQFQAMGGAAQGLPGSARGAAGVAESQTCTMAREIRRQRITEALRRLVAAGTQTAGRSRGPVLGSVSQGGQRTLRRAGGKEPGFQENLRAVEKIPRRPVAMVSGSRRNNLRQFRVLRWTPAAPAKGAPAKKRVTHWRRRGYFGLPERFFGCPAADFSSSLTGWSSGAGN